MLSFFTWVWSLLNLSFFHFHFKTHFDSTADHDHPVLLEFFIIWERPRKLIWWENSFWSSRMFQLIVQNTADWAVATYFWKFGLAPYMGTCMNLFFREILRILMKNWEWLTAHNLAEIPFLRGLLNDFGGSFSGVTFRPNSIFEKMKFVGQFAKSQNRKNFSFFWDFSYFLRCCEEGWFGWANEMRTPSLTPKNAVATNPARLLRKLPSGAIPKLSQQPHRIFVALTYKRKEKLVYSGTFDRFFRLENPKKSCFFLLVDI